MRGFIKKRLLRWNVGSKEKRREVMRERGDTRKCIAAPKEGWRRGWCRWDTGALDQKCCQSVGSVCTSARQKYRTVTEEERREWLYYFARQRGNTVG